MRQTPHADVLSNNKNNKAIPQTIICLIPVAFTNSTLKTTNSANFLQASQTNPYAPEV